MAKIEVRMDTKRVKAAVAGSTEAVLAKLALRIEERAKLNIRENDQIDTGFMVNSIYAVSRRGSGYGAAEMAAMAQTTGRDGRQVSHEGDMAPQAGLEGGADGAVVVGAVYAIYQEAANAFLWPAGQAAIAEFGGEATRVYAETMPKDAT